FPRSVAASRIFPAASFIFFFASLDSLGLHQPHGLKRVPCFRCRCEQMPCHSCHSGNSLVWSSDRCPVILLRAIAGHKARNICFICSHPGSGRQNSLTDLTGAPRVTRIGDCAFLASSVAQGPLCIRFEWVCDTHFAVLM